MVPFLKAGFRSIGSTWTWDQECKSDKHKRQSQPHSDAVVHNARIKSQHRTFSMITRTSIGPIAAQRLCDNVSAFVLLESRPQARWLGRRGYIQQSRLGGNGEFFFLSERGVSHSRPYLPARRAMN